MLEKGLQFIKEVVVKPENLAVAEAHLHDPNFTAERYFLAHPDPTISKLAADMINSRRNTQILR